MIFEQLNKSACKTYLIMNGKDKKAILVDPVIVIASDYLKLIKEKGWELTHVIDTHTHADHISAGPLLKAATGCEYIMHRNAPADCVTMRVEDGDVLKLNDIEFEIIHTPGHTKDSITLVVDGKILTGDVLFLDDGGGGRDDLPGGDPSDHWESLQKIKNLSDSFIVFPAHDYADRQPSSLGKQRTSNPHLMERDKQEFVQYLKTLQLEPEEWMKDVLKVNYDCTKDPEAAWIPENNKACEIKGLTGQDKEKIEIIYIDPEELRVEILSQKNNLVLLDVREEKELTESFGHIEGIVHIPLGSLGNRIKELEQYRSSEIVVICLSGARSVVGARILMKAGFNNVKVLKGGMMSWRKTEK